MNNVKVLLAEDEASLGMIVKESLESRNFTVFHAENGEKALDIYKTKLPDILVLDVMMPKKDGFTLAKEIRQQNKQIPIIFLTAKSQTADVLEGFNNGGNDYLKKPFSMEELIVRIKNLLQREVQQTATKIIKIGNYQFNITKQTLTIYNKETQLTHRETQLLSLLFNKKNEVVERTIILNKLWGNDNFFTARSMDVFISRLRKKLQNDKNVQIINSRGFGYKLIC
ncbi:response regulator transcription factor [Polaribacter tangerinus]|uniref:response regulator transcription factor n=1 Tax=Polaribacter tangerinus TaxID=1920034 RepID=UPI000B4B9D6E|nr:response regulator transcription factor [Polaribacter tangerinus]